MDNLNTIPIPGYPMYRIARDGSIFSDQKNNFKVMTPSLYKSGYLRVNIVDSNKKSKKFLLHRLIAICFIPNPLNLKYVNHRDGDKLNNHIDNLEWCTQSYNVLHAFKTGLKKPQKGILNGQSKVNEAQVVLIKTMLLDKSTTNKSISIETGISIHIVNDISSGRNWKHINI